MPKNETDGTLIKSIPKNEHAVLSYYSSLDEEKEEAKRLSQSRKTHTITQNIITGEFTLYKCMENGFIRIKKAPTPSEFDNIVYPKNKRK